MDTQMLFGCSSFVATSLLTYLLFVGPHLLLVATHERAVLFMGLAIGGVPTALLGSYATRRFGLPAAAGFLGGAMASATFLYLRLQQVTLQRGVPRAPQPEFPDSWVWMTPAAWLVFVAILIAVFLRKEELSLREE